MSIRRLAVAGTGLAIATATLVACGGSSSSSSSSSASSTSAAASSSSTGSAAAGGRGFGAEFSNPAVQACLKAAGIAVPTLGTRTGRPSGSFTRPTGVRPSGSFTGRPSGAGGFGGQNSVQLQQIEAALKACGITLPSRTAGGGATPAGTPSATPSS